MTIGIATIKNRPYIVGKYISPANGWLTSPMLAIVKLGRLDMVHDSGADA